MKLLPFLIGLAAAKQVANLNVTKAEAEKYDCGDACQKLLAVANKADLEVVGKDYDSEFYATASNFSTKLEPGKILKLAPLDPKHLTTREGSTVYRMQYTSVDYNGSVVPVSGFIAFPQYPIHGPKYRLAAFGHGTIGAFAGCAPSNGPSLYDYNTWFPLMDRGYAVVGTDYAGLGNNYTSHKYLYLPSQANDIYYSVKAARSVFGSLFTDQWVSYGHSQGGGAVWKLAESKHVKNDTNYLGTVALAPATYVIDMFLKNLNGSQFAGYLPFLPIAVQRVNPGFTPTLLSETMKKRVQLAINKQMCINAMLSLPTDLSRDQLLNATGLQKDRAAFNKFQKDISPAQGDKSPAPILIIQGLNDTSVLPGTTKEAWENSCKDGNQVHLRLYEGMEHSPSVGASLAEWLAWIDGRFTADRTVDEFAANCTKYTRKAFNSKYVQAPPEIDIDAFLGQDS